MLDEGSGLGRKPPHPRRIVARLGSVWQEAPKG